MKEEQQLTVEEAEEVVVDVLEGDDREGDRVIHVYGARGEDDFRLTIPRKSRVTFGYFNPASAGQSSSRYEVGGSGAQTMKTTALRIYEGGEKSPQLACFLGVAGFRDTSIAITRLKKRVVVERQYADDGEGEEVWRGKHTRELMPHNEDDDFAF